MKEFFEGSWGSVPTSNLGWNGSKLITFGINV